MQGVGVLEVLGQALPQAFGFAYVDNATLGIEEPVNTRTIGNAARRRAVERWIHRAELRLHDVVALDLDADSWKRGRRWSAHH
jgi:hypothetical protein